MEVPTMEVKTMVMEWDSQEVSLGNASVLTVSYRSIMAKVSDPVASRAGPSRKRFWGLLINAFTFGLHFWPSLLAFTFATSDGLQSALQPPLMARRSNKGQSFRGLRREQRCRWGDLAVWAFQSGRTIQFGTPRPSAAPL